MSDWKPMTQEEFDACLRKVRRRVFWKNVGDLALVTLAAASLVFVMVWLLT